MLVHVFSYYFTIKPSIFACLPNDDCIIASFVGYFQSKTLKYSKYNKKPIIQLQLISGFGCSDEIPGNAMVKM